MTLKIVMTAPSLFSVILTSWSGTFSNEFPKSYGSNIFLYIIIFTHPLILIILYIKLMLYLSLFPQYRYLHILASEKVFKSAYQIPTVLNIQFIVNVSINIAISSIDSSQPPLSHFKSIPICALVM